MKAPSLTWELHLKTGWLESCGRGGRIPCVAVKCVEMWRNTGGEGGPWTKTDAQGAKAWGAKTGLDTLVVHAVNDVDLEVVVLNRGFWS